MTITMTRKIRRSSLPWFCLLLVAAVLLTGAPATAAERIDAIPDFKYPPSGRTRFVYAIDKVPQALGTDEFVQGEGFSHDHQVVVDLRDGSTIEAVTINDTTFIRRNAERRWKTMKGYLAFPVAGGFPELPMENASYYRVGDVAVDGVATMHYQVQIDPAGLSLGTLAANVNFFIGKGDNYIYKFQVTELRNDSQMGDVLHESVAVWSAHDQPIVVGPPPPELVD